MAAACADESVTDDRAVERQGLQPPCDGVDRRREIPKAFEVADHRPADPSRHRLDDRAIVDAGGMAEPGDDRRDQIGREIAAQRGGEFRRAFGDVDHAREGARADTVDRDIAAADRGGERQGQSLHRALGRSIGRARRAAVKPLRRAGVDDPPAVGGAHMRQDGAAEIVGSPAMAAPDGLEFGETGVHEIGWRQEIARIVDQRVDPAMRRDQAVDQRVGFLGRGDVGRIGARAAARGHDRRDRRFGGGGGSTLARHAHPQIVDDHMRAQARDMAGVAFAQSARRAGDQHYRSVQSQRQVRHYPLHR
jgi:hypothetical protein